VLIEKEITTPDQYPLSLNALTLGCNQKSSREPIVHFRESEVQSILDELREKNLLFEHQSSGSRVVKYKHRFCNTEFSSLKFTPQQLGIICVLLLRGPQTPGELRTRTNRLADFANVNEVEAALAQLTDFNGETLLVKLAREPGRRESKYAHLFSGEADLQVSSEPLRVIHSENRGSERSASAELQPRAGSPRELEDALSRIATLEAQVDALTKRLDDMQDTVDILSA
jgi:hypothetical protein